MTRLLLPLLLAACAGRAPSAPPAEPARQAPAVATTGATAADADLARVVERLTVHHASEDCEALTAGLSDPPTALRRAAEEVATPPWVGMIAGKCLIRRHAAAAEATLVGWLVDPEMAGLSRALAREIPALADEALAVRLGQAALNGPAADVAAEALRADPRPAVQALLAP